MKRHSELDGKIQQADMGGFQREKEENPKEKSVRALAVALAQQQM